MTRSYKNYTTEQAIEAAKEVYSVAGFLRKLGIVAVGGNYKTAYRLLQRHNINTDHWTGQGWTKDKQLKDWSEYVRPTTLKKHLITQRGHKCESCNNTEWLGQPIPLELHHVDGISCNNDPTNLQLLCCNCHSFTENYRGRKLKGTAKPRQKYPKQRSEISPKSPKITQYIDKKCLHCQSAFVVPSGNKRYSQRKFCGRSCSDTYNKGRVGPTKINWPSNEELLERLKTLSYVRLAKELGVSDNAIRKRLRR